MLAVSDRMVWIADGRLDRIECTGDVKIEKASLDEHEE